MNYFSERIVQPRVKSFFEQVLQHDRLAHAYLFYGAEGRGKTAFAFALAQLLNCQADGPRPCDVCPSCTKIKHLSHPDVKYVFPISKSAKEKELRDLYKKKAANFFKKLPIRGHLNISIDSIRELKNEAKYAPFEARKRVFIIENVEYFNREAANSFLKLLEEPPDDLLLLLTTSDMNNLLDTIRSRCQPVMFPPFTEKEIEQIVTQTEPTDADIGTLARINDFNISRVFESLTIHDDNLREWAVSFLRGAATANFTSMNGIVDKLAGFKDKNKALAFIEQVSLWLTDAFRYHTTGLTDMIVNRDMAESIQKFTHHFGLLPYDDLFPKLESASQAIKGNGHVALTLTSLGVELARLFEKQAEAT